jgi:hypothetical protein
MKKGQSPIFEYVLLFSISIAIFVISFSIFNIYQVHYLSVGAGNQLDEVKEWISSNILKMYEKYDTEALVIIPIPRYIDNAVYDISLKSSGLTVKNLLTNETKHSNLYGMNQSVQLEESNVKSIKGRVTVKRTQNIIKIS